MTWTFNSKVVGVTFDGRQKNVPLMHPGFKVFWEHEPNNPYDSNAIHLYGDSEKTIDLGHLSASVAKKFVVRMQRDVKQEIFVEQVTGGEDKKSYGLNIKIVIYEDDEEENAKED